MVSDTRTDYTHQDAGPDTESRDNLLIAHMDCAHLEPLCHHPPPPQPPPLPAGIKDLLAKIVVARLPRAFCKQKQDVHIHITRRLVIYLQVLLVKLFNFNSYFLKATLLYKYLKHVQRKRKSRKSCRAANISSTGVGGSSGLDSDNEGPSAVMVDNSVGTGHVVIGGSPRTNGAYVHYVQIGNDVESQVLEMEEFFMPLFTVFILKTFFSLSLSVVFWCFQQTVQGTGYQKARNQLQKNNKNYRKNKLNMGRSLKEKDARATRKKAQLLDDYASISAFVAPWQHLSQLDAGSSHAVCEHVDGDIYGDDGNCFDPLVDSNQLNHDDYSGNSNNPTTVDTSMESTSNISTKFPSQSCLLSTASLQLPTEFKTEYHPCSHQPILHQLYEEFGINNTASPTMTQVNGLLELFLLVTKGMEQVMMKNDAKLQKACDNAGAELTPFTNHVISAPYKGKEMEFEVHTWPVWDWALDLLANPQLAPHFVWDAEWVYKHNGEEYEHFYGEPWTCDHWWDIQSQLPADVENAIPFCFIFTVKGYPVVVQCANLPVDIWNSESVGGGCVVGWLPIVPEDAAEEGKLGYTTLKHIVWHESAIKLFKAMVHFLATGFQHRLQGTMYDVFDLRLLLFTMQGKERKHSPIHIQRSFHTGGNCFISQPSSSLISLDIQTNCMLSAIETELLVFNERLQAYKEHEMNSSIPGLKVDWDFLKVHLWKHVGCCWTDQYDKWHKARSGDDNDDNDDSVLELGFEGHYKPTTIQGIEAECDCEDKAYLRLQRKFTDYINKFLP
ncbi:hypothetical protein F5J12DRAFT_782832 [Pisolithus orientalis]|uniref:uncharacterized protein n=1 Tax=Pisolithus orientalis TaxID=936130 RepID=UPI0022240162|nr:uncharacterized protein F5J12DRAFT_782832 [Pisolithus orientalis]KAI6006563.1 hypothetical protein F5J12DRAFT_782832 [Pisolithus orientalis]